MTSIIRPVVGDLKWATDDLSTSGVDIGLTTKIKPTAGERLQGFNADVGADSQAFNFLIHELGGLLEYYKHIDFLNWTPIDVASFTPSSVVGGPWGAIAVKPDPDLLSPVAARYVAVVQGTNGEVWRSANGVTWLATGQVDGANVDGVDHPRALFYSQVASLWICGPSNTSSNNDFFTSPDSGQTWTQRADPSVGNEHGGMSERTTGTAIIVCPTGEIVHSIDGINWIKETDPTPGTLRSSAYSPDLDLFVVVGSGGSIASSPDALAWTNRSTGSANFNDVAWNSDNGFFVACADGGVVFRSTDGIAWTDVNLTTDLAEDFRSISSDGGGTLYMSSVNYIMRSLDGGASWQTHRVPGGVIDKFFIMYVDDRPIVFGGSNVAGAEPGLSLGFRASPFSTITP